VPGAGGLVGGTGLLAGREPLNTACFAPVGTDYRVVALCPNRDSRAQRGPTGAATVALWGCPQVIALGQGQPDRYRR